jgi:hypothetical protein
MSQQTWGDVAYGRNQEPTDGYRRPPSGEPSWGDVAADRNQRPIDDYDRGDVKKSIHDKDVQDQLTEEEQERLDREREAWESWHGSGAYDDDVDDRWGGGQPPDQQQLDNEEAERELARQRRRRPKEFDQATTSKKYFGRIDARRAQRRYKSVRHPVDHGKKKIKKRFKKKWGTHSKTIFHREDR